ncbi:hypothetical protein M3Y97_00916100 [Aphelenchoides bicaudatus]|nr:hypothetical protein M3Y97_00916100 [Aphelenchoides bicaudatus]
MLFHLFVLLLFLLPETSASNWKISQLVDKCPDRNAHLYFSVRDEVYEWHIDRKKYYADTLIAGYNSHSDGQEEEEVPDVISMTYDSFHHSLLYIKEEPKPRIYEFILRNDSWDYYDFDDDLHFKEISFDSITGNLYYLAQDNSIGVCVLHESRCEVVVEAIKNDTSRFRDMVLYPERGLIFWVRKDDDERTLQMASMNGENVRTVEKLFDVRAVTVDQENGLVFVANKTDIMEFDLDVNWMLYRKDLMSFQLNEPGLSIHEVTAFDTPLAIGINSKKLNRMKNPCIVLNCDGICAIGENTQDLKATCICKNCSTWSTSNLIIGAFFVFLLFILIALFLLIEFRLVPAFSNFVERRFGKKKHRSESGDINRVLLQINAQDNDAESRKLVDPCEWRNGTLYFADRDKIYKKDLDSNQSASEFLFDGSHFDAEGEIHHIVSLTYSSISRSILFINEEFGSRIYQFNVDDKTTTFHNFDRVEFKEIAVDTITENLYFISKQSDIGVCSLKTRHCGLLLPKTEKNETGRNHNLLLHSHLARLFWINEIGGKSTFHMSSMNGKKIRTFMRFEKPKVAALDPEEGFLFVVDDKKLLEMNLDGSVKEVRVPISI